MNRARFLILALMFSSKPICAQPRVITTIAGGYTWVFADDGLPATSARTGIVTGVRTDAQGNLFFIDSENMLVMKVTPDGVLHVVAGNGVRGYSGDGGPATFASINTVGGLVIDLQGNIYIADTYNARVRRVSADGIITTVAGCSTTAVCNSGDGGLAVNTMLNGPLDVALDTSGTLYISDYSDCLVRTVTGDGVMHTFAGNDTCERSSGGLAYPSGVAFDSAGNVFILTSEGLLKTAPSKAPILFVDADTLLPPFGAFEMLGLAIDPDNNLYVSLSDFDSNSVAKVTPAGAVSLFAGGRNGFSGDGGKAINAAFGFAIYDLNGLAADRAGNIYIADHDNGRIRKVGPDGIIAAVAGNGQYGYSGDGTPAIDATISYPGGLAVDRDHGTLYVADPYNHRVRRISANGTIDTIAGNGAPADTGNGGPASAASILAPEFLSLDMAGNLYISGRDYLRRISPDGTISTVAGNGKISDDFRGLSGPALQATLSAVNAMAADANGNVYVASTDLIGFETTDRLRRISPDGTITTLPVSDSVFDLAADAVGNVYLVIGDLIRKLSPGGNLQTIAGGGRQVGDGGLATNAEISPAGLTVGPDGRLFFREEGLKPAIRVIGSDGRLSTIADLTAEAPPYDPNETRPDFAGIAVDSRGTVYVSEPSQRRIRAVLPTPPPIQVSTAALNFTGNAGASLAPAKSLSITGAVPVLPVTLTVKTDDGSNWLSISANQGTTTMLIDVTADPSGLTPGIYRGTISVNAPEAAPPRIDVAVVFTVAAALPAKLVADKTDLSFAFPRGSFSLDQSVTLRNTGSGSVNITATATEDNGKQQNWLKVTPGAGTVSPKTPLSLTVTGAANGLAPGTYSGRIGITAPGLTPIAVAVTMTISAQGASLLLSQTGLSFTTVAQGGVVPPQDFGVLTIGSSSGPLAVEPSTLRGGNWLKTSAANQTAGTPLVNVSVDPTGLAAGWYYGLAKVKAAGAANSPQVLTAFLNVLPAASDLGALLRPNELIFRGVEGDLSPGAQQVFLYNPTGTVKNFAISVASSGKQSIPMRTVPTTGLLRPDQPARILVQPQTDTLTPGTYRTTLTFQLSDGRIRVLPVTLLLAAAGVGGKQSRRFADEGCTATQLVPSILSMGNDFSLPAGWPQALQADVRDDCDRPLTSGSVIAEFSNGDPPLSLIPLGDGRWDNTWRTGAVATSGVTVTLRAQNAGGSLRGTRQVAGGLGTTQQEPVIAPNGISSAANGAAVQTVAPGSVITIQGDRLALGQATYSGNSAGPVLAGTTAIIAGEAMPLLSAGNGQVKAIVPYGLALNTRQQILLQRGETYSHPIPINLAEAQPGIFTSPDPQAVVYNGTQIVDAAHPVSAGTTITIWCTGLGEVQPKVASGTSGPALPGAGTANNVTLTIGGIGTPVTYAGLAPGQVGLYWVTATVPSGLKAGTPVPLVITVETAPAQVSAAANLAIK